MNKIKGSIFALLGTTIFSINFVSMKILVDVFPNMFLIALRFLLASLTLYIIIRLRKISIKIKNFKDLKELAITGFFGMSFYYIFFSFSLKYISPSLSSLLCSMIPILTLFINSIINKKKPKTIYIICFLISIIGVYLAIDLNFLQSNKIDLLMGILLMFLAVLGWIYYTIRVNPITDKYSSLVMLMYQSFFGGMINLLLSFLTNDLFYRLSNININLNIIMHLLFVSIFGSALGYFLFNLGIKHLGVTISSSYNNIMPGITLFVSFLILDTNITLRKIIGIVIVIIMTFLVTFYKEPIKTKLKKVS